MKHRGNVSAQVPQEAELETRGPCTGGVPRTWCWGVGKEEPSEAGQASPRQRYSSGQHWVQLGFRTTRKKSLHRAQQLFHSQPHTQEN